MPSSACRPLWAPSKLNGQVTTPTVRAPDSLAIWARTGAAPVPVPPPIPAATNTMSASRIASNSSSRPLLGGAHPKVGVASDTLAARQLLADPYLERHVRLQQRLGVGG